MRIFTLSELSRYSSATLRALAARMAEAIAALPQDSIERTNALINLSIIRRMLAHRHMSPH